MNLKLIIRKPWELGYGIKRIVEDADFELPLNQAGWVGEMMINLPRPDFDFVRLGDEIEVYPEGATAPIWVGKVVYARYDQSNVAQVIARGLCEFAYDLPVDALYGAQNSSWTPLSLWTSAGNIIRQHWSRIVAESESILSPTIPEPIDLRGRSFGDVWRMLLQLNADVVVKPSLKTVRLVSNRLAMKLALRSATPIRISRDQFSEWELECDSRQVQNRLLVTYRSDQPENMFPDFSFEDPTTAGWVVTGSGSEWLAQRMQAHYNNVAPWCSHVSMLYILIPAQSPAGSVVIKTKDKINFGEETRQFSIACWVNGKGLGEVFEIWIGATRIAQVALADGWQFISQTFSTSGQYQVSFKVIGTTNANVIVFLDHVLLVPATLLSLAPPLIVGAAETNKLATLIANDMAARILRCSIYSGSVWEVFAPTGLDWTSNLVGEKVELWRWGGPFYASERAIGTIASVIDQNTIRVNITEAPEWASPNSFVGGVIRLLESGEAFYGVRYQTIVVANNVEAVALMKAMRQANIFLKALIPKTDSIIPVDAELVVPEFANVQPSFPVVSNTLIVKAGELVAQRIEAGSQELTLRGFMRKLQKHLTEYAQTR